jgi:glutamine cyclotransferase
MKKAGILLLTIALIVAFIIPYLGSENEVVENEINFGFDSAQKFFSVKRGEDFEFTCTDLKNIDELKLDIDGVIVKSWKLESNPKQKFSFSTNKLDLGTYSIELQAYNKNELLGSDGGRFLFINAEEGPKEFIYEILSTHPHNPENFTQGYEFYNNVLFESTGNPNQTNATKVARIDENTGASVLEAFQPNPVFGEGITILESKIYQISWQDQKCFVYNSLDLSLLDSLRYDGEGWGLCNNDEYIFMSNGTNELTVRDPENFEILKTIKVHSDKGPVTNLNELEFFNGRIYANVWISEQRFQHDSRMNLNKIVIINPKNGAVEGLLDISKLILKSGAKNVPNGIAYRKSSNSFWLTGKYWEQSFEVQLSLKNTEDAQ